MVNRSKFLRVNLGCGSTKMKGYVNCDSDRRVRPDRLVDITKKLPFRSNSVFEVYTSHTLEHIEKDVLVKRTLPEIWRVCRNGALFKVVVPYMDAQNVLNHKTRFNEDTFKNWCKETYDSSDEFPFRFSFELIKYRFSVPKYWKWLFYLIPTKTWKRLWQSLIHEIRVDTKVRK